MPIKYREIIRLIERTDGSTSGRAESTSTQRPGMAIIAAHGLNDDIPKGILAAVIKQVGTKL